MYIRTITCMAMAIFLSACQTTGQTSGASGLRQVTDLKENIQVQYEAAVLCSQAFADDLITSANPDVIAEVVVVSLVACRDDYQYYVNLVGEQIRRGKKWPNLTQSFVDKLLIDAQTEAAISLNLYYAMREELK